MNAAVTLQVLHVLAGLVVLAEALNKMQRTDPLRAGLAWRPRTVESLKALAWFLLGLGAAGALAGPLFALLGLQTPPAHWLRMGPPTTDQVAVLVGFAVLIVRTRVKEG